MATNLCLDCKNAENCKSKDDVQEVIGKLLKFECYQYETKEGANE